MMISNTDLKRIGETLQAADSVLLFPHNHPDGDAIGSCTALCRVLRKMGKEVWVILEEGLSAQLGFLDDGLCTTDGNVIEDPQVTVAVDCSDSDRFSMVEDFFAKGSVKIAIDHHMIDTCDQDLYYIDPEAASNTEIIFQLIKAMEWEIDPECAESLYVGLVTDTGSFMHSNTTSNTHRIAAELIDKGVDINKVSVYLFKNTDPRTVAVEADILNRIELFAGGKAAMVSLSLEQLRKCGAEMEHADFIIDHLIKIAGVEVAATLKEKNDGISLSMRSKTNADVKSIAAELGGGGHIKAAGATLRMPMDEAYAKVRKAIEDHLAETEIQ